LALLPVFVVPARRFGRRLARLQREAADHNAAMGNQMTERFSAPGATLVKLFGRPTEEVAEFVARAARGLGAIGDMDATDRLLELMAEHQRPGFVHQAAAEALGALGNPDAVGPLERELTDGHGWSEQSTAAQALRRLGPPGETVLSNALRSRDAAVRAHAQVALES